MPLRVELGIKVSTELINLDITTKNRGIRAKPSAHPELISGVLGCVKPDGARRRAYGKM